MRKSHFNAGLKLIKETVGLDEVIKDMTVYVMSNVTLST